MSTILPSSRPSIFQEWIILRVSWVLPCNPLIWVIKGHFTHETESPWPIHFKALSLVEKPEPVQVRYFTLCLRDQQSEYVHARWMQSLQWILTWHRTDHVSWSLGLFFKNHPLEVGLTEYQETLAFRTLAITYLFYFNHVWGRVWNRNSSKQHLVEGLHDTRKGPWPHYMSLEVSWDDLWTLSFGLSQFHGHGYRLMCEVTLRRTTMVSR